MYDKYKYRLWCKYWKSTWDNAATLIKGLSLVWIIDWKLNFISLPSEKIVGNRLKHIKLLGQRYKATEVQLELPISFEIEKMAKFQEWTDRNQLGHKNHVSIRGFSNYIKTTQKKWLHDIVYCCLLRQKELLCCNMFVLVRETQTWITAQ